MSCGKKKTKYLQTYSLKRFICFFEFLGSRQISRIQATLHQLSQIKWSFESKKTFLISLKAFTRKGIDA